jgi:hypothetical protein
MNENAARIDGTARVLLEDVNSFVQRIVTDQMRCEMQATDAEKGLHALAVLEELAPKLSRLAHAHEMLAAALNVAHPDDTPILSMVTLEPATLEGAGIAEPPELAQLDEQPDDLRVPNVHLNGRFTAEGLRGIADALEQGHLGNGSDPG